MNFDDFFIMNLSTSICKITFLIKPFLSDSHVTAPAFFDVSSSGR